MSQEKLTEFMTKAQGDQTLMAEAKDAIENSEGPDKFVALGRKNGYDFTEEELVRLLSKSGTELSEAELSAVAGGLGFFSRFNWNSWVISGLVATAIAVPIAISNSHHNQAS